jgi:hypothetical protein
MARPIRRARELLVADLSSALDPHDLAAAAGLPYETFRKAIAASLGFADENHFAKRFRACVGTSPKQYRRANTARSGAGTPSARPF